ncbi:chymotrypsin precursor-1 protein, partial [Aphelenchoides avenae]
TDEDARPYSFPWAAILCQRGYPVNGTAGCLFDTIGSVVHRHWVLGPYEERTSRVILVKVGYYDAQHKGESGAQVIPIVRQVNCPCKAFSLYRLSTEIAYTDHIQPVCLPSTDMLSKQNDSEAVMVGWASHATGSLNLRQIRVNVTTWAKLPNAYGILTNYSTNKCTNTLKKRWKMTCKKNDYEVAAFQMVDGTSLLRAHHRKWFQYGFTLLDFHPAFPYAYVTRISPLCGWMPSLTDGEVKCV